MATNLGFGKPQPKAKPSKRSQERTKAAQAYEKMQAGGALDYEAYIRVQGKKQWYPVGVIAVKRSNQINRAIFDSQEQLLQGAFRLYPILRKHQHQLEYGYRLKQYKDEPIQLAEPPKLNSAGGMQAAVAQLKDRVLALVGKR
ncbi:MAG: DUF6523 family protein [Elainellaceae cyanobacterium]